jgi:hypothetical protein
LVFSVFLEALQVLSPFSIEFELQRYKGKF